MGSEKRLKDLENHQRMHRKYWLKCLGLQKKYPSHDIVPLKFKLKCNQKQNLAAPKPENLIQKQNYTMLSQNTHLGL